MFYIQCHSCKKNINSSKNGIWTCTSHGNYFCKECGFKNKCFKKSKDCILQETPNDEKFMKMITILSNDGMLHPYVKNKLLTAVNETSDADL